MQVKVSVLESSHPRYEFEVHYPDGEKRKVKYFGFNKDERETALNQPKRTTRKVEKRANTWADSKRAELVELGAKNKAISEAERRAVHTFRDVLEELPVSAQHYTLQDAVEFFTKSLKIRHNSLTCHQVTAAYIDELEAAQKSPRHIETTDGRLKRFNAEYGDWLVSDISVEILNDFLKHLKTVPTKQRKAKALSPSTKNNFRLSLSGMFSHAVKLNAAKENPAEKAIKFKTVEKEIGILSPKNVEKLLNSADESCLAGIAISFFAGLRRSEIEQLNWEWINLKQGLIKLPAKITKNNKKRNVTISENLKLWLEPLHKNTGKVTGTYTQWRRSFEKARLHAGITEWPQNAGRHSFASYHIATYEDAGKTAFQLGHSGDVRILNEHYDAVAEPEDAKAFWAIKPTIEEKILNIKSA